MRIVPVFILSCAACGSILSHAEPAFGNWKVNPSRSTDPYAKTLMVRFEPHAKGEVFTLDWIEGDGRVTSSSTILYLDGKARDFQDFVCSGTQSSRRIDTRTVEVRRNCANGDWIRFVRRLPPKPNELVLEITEDQASHRRLERRLVFEKQPDPN